MTTAEIQAKIREINDKILILEEKNNKTKTLIQTKTNNTMILSGAGIMAGFVFANYRKGNFWNYLGWGLVGSAVLTVPYRLISSKELNEAVNNYELTKKEIESLQIDKTKLENQLSLQAK